MEFENICGTDSKPALLKPALLSKYDPVTFQEFIFLVCWFKKIKFHRRTFFRFCALKLLFKTPEEICLLVRVRIGVRVSFGVRGYSI